MIIHTYPHYQTPSEWFLLVKNQEAREGAQLLSIYSTACAQLSTNVEGEVKNWHQQTNPLLHFWLVPHVTTGTVVYDIKMLHYLFCKMCSIMKVSCPFQESLKKRDATVITSSMKYSCERWSNKRIYKTEIVIVRWTKPTQLELQVLIPLNYNYAASVTLKNLCKIHSMGERLVVTQCLQVV